MIGSMLKGALAQRVELASAQAITVIWCVHVWHGLGAGDCDDVGGSGTVKEPVRLPASSRAQVGALRETSRLLIEQPAGCASAAAACGRQISTAGHSRITTTKAVILYVCRYCNVIALTLAAARLTGVRALLMRSGEARTRYTAGKAGTGLSRAGRYPAGDTHPPVPATVQTRTARLN